MAFLATPALVAMAGGSILDAVGSVAVRAIIPYPTALLPAYQYLFSNPTVFNLFTDSFTDTYDDRFVMRTCLFDFADA